MGSSYFGFNYHLCPLSPETSQRRHGWLAHRQRQPSNHFNGNGRYSIVIQRCCQVSFGCYSHVWHCSISGMSSMVSMETSFKRIIYLHQTCMYAYKQMLVHLCMTCREWIFFFVCQLLRLHAKALCTYIRYCIQEPFIIDIYFLHELMLCSLCGGAHCLRIPSAVVHKLQYIRKFPRYKKVCMKKFHGKNFSRYGSSTKI